MLFLLPTALASQCMLLSDHPLDIHKVSCEGAHYIAWGSGGAVRYHRAPPTFPQPSWTITETIDTTTLTGGPSVGVVISSTDRSATGTHRDELLLILEPDGIWMRERLRVPLASAWLTTQPFPSDAPPQRLAPTVTDGQLVLTPEVAGADEQVVLSRSCPGCPVLLDVSARAGRWVLEGDALARPSP